MTVYIVAFDVWIFFDRLLEIQPMLSTREVMLRL